MKILTFKYNIDESAIRISTLMSDKRFAEKNMYRLARPEPQEPVITAKTPSTEKREYIIPGTWQ